MVLVVGVVACSSGLRPVSDVESESASYDGAPPWAGPTWTTRMRSALTRKLDVRLVEAAGGRMRFVGLPMAVKYSDRFKARERRHAPEILDPAAAAC